MITTVDIHPDRYSTTAENLANKAHLRRCMAELKRRSPGRFAEFVRNVISYLSDEDYFQPLQICKRELEALDGYDAQQDMIELRHGG